MSEWRETTLSEIVEIIPGYAFKGKHFGDAGSVVIKIKDINPPYVDLSSALKVDMSNYAAQNLEKYKLEKGQAVLAMTGATIGKIGRLKETEDVFVNQRVAKFAAKEGYNYDYAIYSISGDDFQSFIQNNIDSNSAQENISATSIGRYPISLPPLPEQKAIAEVLSSLDDKIDLLHRQNKTLEQMAETLFRQWFVEEAQEDWEEKQLSEYFELLGGFAFKSKDYLDTGQYKVITIKGVQDGFLDTSSAARLNVIPEKVKSYQVLELGDILMSLTGNVGRVCLVDENNCLLNQRVAKIEPLNKRWKPFSYFYFRQRDMIERLTYLSKGSAQLNLSPVETVNQVDLFSDDSVIDRYCDKVTPMYEKIIKNKIQIHTLEKLRDTLLPKLMSGEVRVN